MPRSTPMLTALTASLLLVGCAAQLPAGTAQRRAELAELRHPVDVPFAGDLDIAVRRDGGDLHLINREPRVFEGAVLWLNQQYAGTTDQISIGPNNRVPLQAFVNRHGETFPMEAFLAPDAAETLLAAELLAADGTRHRLTVWPDERWYD